MKKELKKHNENQKVEKNEKKYASESDYWDDYMKSLDPYRYTDLDTYFNIYKSLHATRLYLSHDYGKDFNMHTFYHLGFYLNGARILRLL